MSRRWLDVEVQYLTRYAGTKSSQELADRLHTDAETIEEKLRELRIDSAAGSARADSEVQLIATFERGMQALYAERWKEAADALSEVAEGDGPVEVVARARQYSKVAATRARSEKPSDPYLEAVVLKNSGDFAGALALCAKSDRGTDESRFAYLSATIEVLQGDLAKAAKHLKRAYALDARSRGQARHDPDLKDLRDDESYESLFVVGS